MFSACPFRCRRDRGILTIQFYRCFRAGELATTPAAYLHDQCIECGRPIRKWRGDVPAAAHASAGVISARESFQLCRYNAVA